MIHILDVIDHRSEYFTQRKLVVDRMPNFVFVRRSGWLIGEDSGFFKFYAHDPVDPSWPSNWKAFGGAKFDIPLADGTAIHTVGQWWDAFPDDFRGLTYGLGVNTVEGLSQCHVFMGGIHVDCELVDAWLRDHEPSNNYHKYDTRHADFGKHTIVSRWECKAVS